MADKTVVYCKRSGEPLIPLTVRIEWLSDGTIRPLIYWTPDGSCYKILSQKGVPLAFLKDGGEGLRFEVRAELIEMPETDDEFLHSQYETYLYLSDRRFFQRNIIDERYDHAGKKYIPITMDVFPDGDYELVYFRYQEDRYKVEKTLGVEPRGSFYGGGTGIWHKVEARLINESDDNDPDPDKSVYRLAALYFEINKWFVAVKHTA